MESHDKLAMSESIITLPRLQEKQDLQFLNARLSQYIVHMREMKEHTGYMDSTVLQESITVLEQEIIKVKNLYNKELENVRIQLDEMSKAKSQLEMEVTKATSVGTEFKSRFQSESDKNKTLLLEVQSLHEVIAKKDMELEKTRIAMQTPLQQLQNSQKEHKIIVMEFDDLKNRLDSEQLARKEAEVKLLHMKKQIEFQTSLFEQEKAELSGRVAAASSSMIAMEQKMRSGGGLQYDQQMNEMLMKIQASHEDHLKKYQLEMEERHKKYLYELKAQTNVEDKRCAILTEENFKLNGDITNLYGRIRELEGQVGSLENQRKCLLEQLEKEKLRAARQMITMEMKLKEAQEVLVKKMYELNAARDAQIPLKAEIESFRALLEEEENRLKLKSVELPSLPAVRYQTKSEFTSRSGGQLSMPRLEGFDGGLLQMYSGRTSQRMTPSYLTTKNNTVPGLELRKQQQQQHNSVEMSKDYLKETFKAMKYTESEKNMLWAKTAPKPAITNRRMETVHSAMLKSRDSEKRDNSAKQGYKTVNTSTSCIVTKVSNQEQDSFRSNSTFKK